MEYDIKDIRRIEGGFEVDVEYTSRGEKKQLRFSFGMDAWENDAWKKTIDTRMIQIEKSEGIEIDKTKFIGKHTAKEVNPTSDNPTPSAAISNP